MHHMMLLKKQNVGKIYNNKEVNVRRFRDESGAAEDYCSFC